jgi:hypothetical protein
MGLSQTSASLYRVVITPFIVMPDFNPNKSQIFLKWVLGVPNVLHKYGQSQRYLRYKMKFFSSIILNILVYSVFGTLFFFNAVKSLLTEKIHKMRTFSY